MATHFFHSGMLNAPVLSGTAGALLAVLDACLVNGWGLVSVDSLVVSSGVATATISAGHSADVDVVVLIAGATPAGLNGLKRVTLKTNQTVKFDATGIADGAATGSITMKVAPVGWVKEFSGTNVAAYHSGDPSSTQMRARVDDSATTYARILGYETMSDLDNGTNMFPTALQLAGGGVWHKSDAAGASARGWQVYADEKAFYVVVASYGADTTIQRVYFFGDIVPASSTDGFACGAFFSNATAHSQTWAEAMFMASPTVDGMSVLARSYTGVPGAITLSKSFDRINPAQSYGNSGTSYGNSVPYPNPADSGLLLSPIRIFEPNLALRGHYPGVYASPQVIPDGSFSPMTAVTGVDGLPGRTLRAAVGYQGGSQGRGKLFFDATGPWR